MRERAAPVDPEAILAFWFGETGSSPDAGTDRDRIWFGGDAETDRVIRERFAALPDQAARGDLDDWAAQPRSALALVLVLDQFPRNLHRGTAQSFAYDDQALQVAAAAIRKGFDFRLEPVEAVFLYMPFEHSEELPMQQRSLELFGALVGRAPPALHERMKNYESYAIRHHRIIARFGRFPHRNAVLGRDSTAEERAYLESGGDTF